MAENNNVATMRDVAELAGVSQSTVSRILSQTDSKIPISEKTKARVFDAIQKLGYRPNITARSLRTQRTQLIAIMIADISNSMYHNIVRTVQSIALSHDYDVLIANTDHRYGNEQHFCEAVIRRPVDGVIMVPFRLSMEEIDQFMRQAGTPVVVLGQHVNHPLIDVVYADDENGTFEAVRWLINQKGHHRIGFIGVSDLYPPGPRRLSGYQRALAQEGLPVESTLIHEGDFSARSGYRAMEAMMSQVEPPTAVFVANDLMAFGALNAAQDLGFAVPGDVAVMGFDNVPECELIRPHLTTVAQDPGEIGKQLAGALFSRIEADQVLDKRCFEVECRIVERQSA